MAARALSGVTLADVGNATHFHAVSVGQPWGGGLVRVAQVGMHVFYRFNRGHGPFQAQVFQASVRKPDAGAPQIKPVLASLLPPPAAEEPKPEPQAGVQDAGRRGAQALRGREGGRAERLSRSVLGGQGRFQVPVHARSSAPGPRSSAG